jgi:hypothetical protein
MTKTPLIQINGVIFCDFQQVVRLSELAPATVEREILQGRLKIHQTIGKRLFTVSDVSDFLKARQARKAAR